MSGGSAKVDLGFVHPAGEKAGGSWSCEDMTIVLLHAKVFRF
jgi:hypothetical protein